MIYYFSNVKQITLQFTIVSTVAVPAPARLVPLPIPRAQSPCVVSFSPRVRSAQFSTYDVVQSRLITTGPITSSTGTFSPNFMRFTGASPLVSDGSAHRAVIVSHQIFHGARARDEPDETRERKETRARPPFHALRPRRHRARVARSDATPHCVPPRCDASASSERTPHERLLLEIIGAFELLRAWFPISRSISYSES